MMDIQNTPAIIFLKTLSSDFSTLLKGTDLTPEARDCRIGSVAFRCLGGLVALCVVPLAAKTIVAMATGGLIFSSALFITTLFHVVLAHDLIQTGYNFRPVDDGSGFINALKNLGKDEAGRVFNDTIIAHPIYLALQGKR